MALRRRHAEQPDGSGRLKRVTASAMVVVVVGLTLTGLATRTVWERERHAANLETQTRLTVMADALDRQVSRYAETLYGLRQSFASNPQLDRGNFGALVDIHALVGRNPGAQSLTFNRLVPRAELPAFERARRAQQPQFKVHPRTPAGDHVIVDYLEPADPDSSAFGLDITADSIRRQALTFARDSGELAATAPLTLVQQPSGTGFLLMLAAYDVTPVPVTAPARARHFLGVIVAVFDAGPMVSQALDARPELEVSIFDAGPTVDAPRTQPRTEDWLLGTAAAENDRFTDINVGSRRWRLVASDPVATHLTAPGATAISGTALTLLVAGVLASLAAARTRAVKLAQSMTGTLRASEEQLRVANHNLTEADRLKDKFLGTVSHEIRTPLTAIVGISDLLGRHNGQETPLPRGLIQQLSASVHDLRTLIDDVLDFSRLQGTSAPSVVEAIDVLEIARQVARTNAPLLSAHQIEVQHGPAPTALGNRQDLRRIVTNLLANAAKYTPAGSLVRITAHQHADTVKITVSDNGPGITHSDLERIFERFYRGSDDATLKQPGAGIGLSVVRDLCERMHARVDAEATTAGATFTITLVAHESTASPAQAARPASG